MPDFQTLSRRGRQADDLVDTFKARSALVAAALEALDAMSPALALLENDLTAGPIKLLVGHVDGLFHLIEGATVQADNLLAVRLTVSSRTLALRAVGRQPSGKVDLRSIEIDRDTLALTGPSSRNGAYPLDRLADAIQAVATGAGTRAAARLAVDEMKAQVRSRVSRLSLFKARLDLQESFVSSVMHADPRASCVRMESHLNHATARDLAQEARRLLSGRSLTTARGNREVLTSLFEDGAAPKS